MKYLSLITDFIVGDCCFDASLTDERESFTEEMRGVVSGGCC